MRGLRLCPLCHGAGYRRIYNSFWRWLFRRPSSTVTCEMCHGASVVPDYRRPSDDD